MVVVVVVQEKLELLLSDIFSSSRGGVCQQQQLTIPRGEVVLECLRVCVCVCMFGGGNVFRPFLGYSLVVFLVGGKRSMMRGRLWGDHDPHPLFDPKGKNYLRSLWDPFLNAQRIV